MVLPTHYQLLELGPQASSQELRQAFRSLSKRYHPDTTTLPAAEASEAFARLRQAYGVLANPESRRAYDAQLQRQRAAALALAAAPPLVMAAPRPVGVRRSLSGGEWFALVLLALALVLSLVLGVGLAWARGAALITRPSWWSEPVAEQRAAAGVAVKLEQTPVAEPPPLASPAPGAISPPLASPTAPGPAVPGPAAPPPVASPTPMAGPTAVAQPIAMPTDAAMPEPTVQARPMQVLEPLPSHEAP